MPSKLQKWPWNAFAARRVLAEKREADPERSKGRQDDARSDRRGAAAGARVEAEVRPPPLRLLASSLIAENGGSAGVRLRKGRAPEAIALDDLNAKDDE